MPNRVTRKMINDALRARDRNESLYPGEGYFFFGGGMPFTGCLPASR